ncbi:MAG: hypothetical protein JRG91_00775 [Deltaproteobacteria bacterium]|nr:hypothetical protein [Deltaproteobacteria bacterium]
MPLARLTPLLLLVAACSGHDSVPGDAGEPDDGDAWLDADVDGAVLDGVEDVADEDADLEDVSTEWTWYEGEVPELPPFTKQEHIVSCMRTRACNTTHTGQLGTCTVSYASVHGREVGLVLGWIAQCVGAADLDCASIQDCLTAGEEPSTCEPLVTPDRCDGTLIRQCSRFSGKDLVVDCDNLGMECFIDADDTAVCGLGTCDASTFRPDCHADVLVVCETGVITLAQCDAAGLHCVQEEGEPGRCAGGGASCTETSDPRRCSGDRVVGCIGGSAADIDCNAVVERWTCGDRGGEAGCVPSGDECDAQPLLGTDLDESCDGEAVTFCLDNYVTTLSCADYGLGPCTDLGLAARCTPP